MRTTIAASQLCDRSATELRAGYLDGEFTPIEVIESTLQRIRDANGDRETGINAFTEVLDDEARTAAAAATEWLATARRHGDPLPPLFAIPLATKEKHALQGHTLEQGLAAHRGRIADHDHPIVTRVKAAGAIIHARTTSPEFSCATVTHSPMWGITRNPFNLAASPGGSSGGAGAALAAGMATLGTASDIAGSTRIPAGFTGTVGYKAPYGRVPGAPPLCADTYRGDGPMARTVADAALLADVMSGRHPSDHSSWGGPGNLARKLAHAPDSLAGIRVGVSISLGDFVVHPDITAATERAADALTQRGAEVVEVTLSWTTAQIRDVIFAHFGHLLGPAMRAETAGGPPVAAYTEQFMRDADSAARRFSHLDSIVADARVQSELAAAMSGVDALLCPVSAVTSLAADGDYLDGIDVASCPETVHLEHYWEAHLTSPFNVANRCPVLAVPAGVASDGVPIGVQLVSHPFDELTPFRLGAALEQELPQPRWRSHSS